MVSGYPYTDTFHLIFQANKEEPLILANVFFAEKFRFLM